ncbi:hypothetical protein GH714_007947 [Hevea brasiliensis]|uniref:Reverse transcriptase RNase H-like domain-containing protein n=1 Tax=Hevea brasiliensis TaxID=3981 RepID=A0A6A6LKA4_HEVBR|nr:hypothetical protein GH714_007947 [Hevea brasiliensis]
MQEKVGLLLQLKDVIEEEELEATLRYNNEIEEVEPVNSRLNRYAFEQKIAIEDMTKDMLNYGVIQNSNSPYASPIVLFREDYVEYLSHVMASDRVHTDAKKVQAVRDWLVPQNIEQLRSFLSFIGYYIRFYYVVIVETNVFGDDIGAILMQDGHPLAYISKALCPKNQALSTYEKVLRAILFAIKHWSHYLSPRHFMIKIDHKSLKPC